MSASNEIATRAHVLNRIAYGPRASDWRRIEELGAEGKPTLIVLNKVDLIEHDPDRMKELKDYFGNKAIFISATQEKNIDQLMTAFCDMLVDRVSRLELRIPQSRQDLVALLHREANIVDQNYEGNDVLLTAIVPHIIKHRFDEFGATPSSAIR